jgi:hypothetical protein
MARLLSAGFLAQALARRKHNLGGSEEESVSLLLEANNDDVFIHEPLTYDKETKEARAQGCRAQFACVFCQSHLCVCAPTPLLTRATTMRRRSRSTF